MDYIEIETNSDAELNIGICKVKIDNISQEDEIHLLAIESNIDAFQKVDIILSKKQALKLAEELKKLCDSI